jgi:hypothetical protein
MLDLYVHVLQIQDVVMCFSGYRWVGVGNWIYWPLTGCNYKQLLHYCWFPTENHSTLSVLSLHYSLLGNSSPQWLFLCSVFTRHFLVTNVSNGDYSTYVARCVTLHGWTPDCTALTRWTEHGRSSHVASEQTYRKHRLHHLFYCCVTSPHMHKLQALHSTCCCL